VAAELSERNSAEQIAGISRFDRFARGGFCKRGWNEEQKAYKLTVICPRCGVCLSRTQIDVEDRRFQGSLLHELTDSAISIRNFNVTDMTSDMWRESRLSTTRTSSSPLDFKL
jgi:hypothetical protein